MHRQMCFGVKWPTMNDINFFSVSVSQWYMADVNVTRLFLGDISPNLVMVEKRSVLNLVPNFRAQNYYIQYIAICLTVTIVNQNKIYWPSRVSFFPKSWISGRNGTVLLERLSTHWIRIRSMCPVQHFQLTKTNLEFFVSNYQGPGSRARKPRRPYSILTAFNIL